MDATTFRERADKIEVYMNSKMTDLVHKVEKEGDTKKIYSEVYTDLKNLESGFKDMMKELRFDLR